VRVRTTSSDSLFRRAAFRRIDRSDLEDRPALGIGIGSAGSKRDSLGVLIISVQDSSPAAAAGLEEGNRIASIDGVDLRVAHADVGDEGAGRAKAQRLRREVARLTPGKTVTLRVYANGRFRDVAVKVARARDLPHPRGMIFFGGEPPAMPMMPDMPRMPAMPRVPVTSRPPLPPEGQSLIRTAPQAFELVRPQLDRVVRMWSRGMVI
jgi:hypothetical protein